MVAEEHDGENRTGGFDPRFDPAFQRGYQPRPGERTQTRVRPDAPDSAYRRPSSVLPSAPDEVAEPEFAPVPERAAAPLDDLDLPPQPAPAPIAAGPGVQDRLDPNPRRNPVMLALWLVGAGFVVLGIVLYAVSVTSSYNGPTPSTDVTALVFAQLGWMLAGPLITVGLLTLVGLLFLTLLAGRRSPQQPRARDEVD
ncbi:MAG: hypothetical protein AAGC66_11615 [Leifsonia sp.]